MEGRLRILSVNNQKSQNILLYRLKMTRFRNLLQLCSFATNVHYTLMYFIRPMIKIHL